MPLTTGCSFGDVVHVPFPFTDQSATKRRPAVTISSERYSRRCTPRGTCVAHALPSPMGFLNGILGRPKDERPFLVLGIGYPAQTVIVPDIRRKPLEKIATFQWLR